MVKSHSSCHAFHSPPPKDFKTLTDWRPSSRHDNNGLGIHFVRVAVCLVVLRLGVVTVCPHYTEMLCTMVL